MTSPDCAKALKIAEQALRANILCLDSGYYLTAGHHQFRTLWTRDFCHSVKGLLLIDRSDVVENHLGLLVQSARAKDGLVPRVLDNHLVQMRVAWESLRSLVPQLRGLSLRDPLRPQYVDEHGSFAIDSNLLVIRAGLELAKHTEDWRWWQRQEESLKKIFSWYEDKLRDGLIQQPPFSDWQDSARRQGPTFLTNLLYFEVAEQLQSLGWSLPIDLTKMREQIKSTFFCPRQKVFLSLPNSPLVSLDGNLLAILNPHFMSDSERLRLWSQLKEHPLILANQGLFGQCSHPHYRNRDLAWHIRVARYHSYHSQLAWSWLMGLGLSAALVVQDEETVDQQIRHLIRVLLRDSTVHEIYEPKEEWKPFRSWLMGSEFPFSWGAAYLIEAFYLRPVTLTKMRFSLSPSNSA